MGVLPSSASFRGEWLVLSGVVSFNGRGSGSASQSGPSANACLRAPSSTSPLLAVSLILTSSRDACKRHHTTPAYRVSRPSTGSSETPYAESTRPETSVH